MTSCPFHRQLRFTLETTVRKVLLHSVSWTHLGTCGYCFHYLSLKMRPWILCCQRFSRAGLQLARSGTHLDSTVVEESRQVISRSLSKAMKDTVIRLSAESNHMGQFSHTKVLTMCGLWKRETRWVGWGEGKKTLEKIAGIFVMKEIFTYWDMGKSFWLINELTWILC